MGQLGFFDADKRLHWGVAMKVSSADAQARWNRPLLRHEQPVACAPENAE